MKAGEYLLAWIVIVVVTTIGGCAIGLIIRNQYLGG